MEDNGQKEPLIGPPAPGVTERGTVIENAVKDIVDSGEDMTKSGLPRLEAVKVSAGLDDVTVEERDEAFAALYDGDEGEPKPTASKFKTDLTRHEQENLVQITGRQLRRGETLDFMRMQRLTASKCTAEDVAWAEQEVLRRSPANEQTEIVAQAIWP